MKSIVTLLLTGLLTGVLALPFSTARAQPSDQPNNGQEALGTVDFGVSCAAEVSDDFDRAMALLHHMQYDEARAALGQIADAHPDCAMAHWGIAMTRFQPLWPTRPDTEALRQGWEEIQTARSLGVSTEREAALLRAAEAFFREPEASQWWTRIERWSDAMSTAYEAHPDDTETAALYALSQLAAGQVASDRMAHHAHAAEILRDIHEREPTHPGAMHYTIHANDVDARAGESLDIVRKYSEIAPSVPHALHMPSHIYVRLGHWSDVIDWNIRSAEAALNLPSGDVISHHYLHALDYLVYAHLQRGEDEKAEAVLAKAVSHDREHMGSFMSAFHLASMSARYAVERRKWDAARELTAGEPDYIPWDRYYWAQAINWFARGLGAVHTSDPDGAAMAEGQMADLRDAARSADETAFAEYIEVDRLVLAAWRAHADGEDDRALDLARQAAELEATTEKHPVTPGALYPAREAQGDLLLELGRPEQALAAYEGALAVWPNRFNSLAGAARAADGAGMEDTANKYYRALLELAADADSSDRPELAEARRYVGE